MEHYVTLFDSLFLPQGLALHASLQRHAGPHTLWILCVDEQALQTLAALALPDVRLLDLRAVETDELRRVKPGRSRGEYCWTLTPFSLRFVFDADATVQRVTYVDADLWLRRSPAPIFREFEASGAGVLITDHAYAPEHDQSATSGRFCVQFMTFTRDGGEDVRQWWADRCIEWCFNRFEEGRFGDQKYLDDWPERFGERVHVLADKELALAPWNATRFPYGNGITWHFHGLRLLAAGGGHAVDFGPYPLPACTCQHVYGPYLDDLRQALDRLAKAGFTARPQKTFTFTEKLLRCLVDLLRRQRSVRPL